MHQRFGTHESSCKIAYLCHYALFVCFLVTCVTVIKRLIYIVQSGKFIEKFCKNKIHFNFFSACEHLGIYHFSF